MQFVPLCRIGPHYSQGAGSQSGLAASVQETDR